MNYYWIIAKIVIIYFILIAILRVLGKREVGQLSIFDLVILLIIADIASIGIDNDEFFWTSLLCLLVLAVLQKLLSLALLHFAKLRNVCDGNPTIIVYEGVLKVKNMKKELYTIDDLVCQMRLEHIMDISEIKMAILETNGTLSIFKNYPHHEVIMPVILSGEYIQDNLECINLEQEKIDRALIQANIEVKKIIYASYFEGFLTYYYKNSSKVQDIKGCKLKI